MRFNRHSGLEGRHAILSPSYYHWLNYDEQKLEARFFSNMSAQRGTDLHELARQAIRLQVPLHPSNEALAAYVNDGIELRMQCEQPLYYSDNCFGTADTLSFRQENGLSNHILRVHDLKNGITATSFKQLEIYDALFCLEYDVDPYDIIHELRIYQRSEVRIHEPTPEGISAIMEKIIESDERIQALKEANQW